MTMKNIRFNQLGKAGYNRGINRAHVNNIKRNFCPDMVQPAIVSFRDGKYWIIDHQHQTQAIYERNGNDPNTLIRCDVREGLTYEQEAELYYKLNTGSKPLSFNDKLVGLIESKDEQALQFRNAVESCGYTIEGRSNTNLQACSRVWKIFTGADGEKRVKDILSLTHDCWPSNPSGVHSRIIDGISVFLYHHGEDYSRAQFVKNLSQRNPREIVNEGMTFYKQMNSKTFTQPYCVYTVIVDAYNVGLRSNKLTPATPGLQRW